MGDHLSEPAHEAWALDEAFSLLGRPFRIRTTSAFAGELVTRIFGDCRASGEGPGGGHEYELFLAPGEGRPASRLVRDGELVMRNADARSVVALLSWHVMNDAVSAASELLVVHAGSVVSPDGGAVVIPAGSGSGKTTLVAGLVRAGFAYLSDEMAAFDPEKRLVLPVPRALSVKAGTFEALGMQAPLLSADALRMLDGATPLRPDELRPNALGRSAPLRAVVAPRYRRGEATRLVPISRAEGLMELAGQAFNVDAFGGDRGVTLLARLLPEASCYRLSVGSLDEAVAAVLGVVAPSD